jgi:hypothetical protein
MHFNPWLIPTALLARALRRRGLNVEFAFTGTPVECVPVPSIAGITMGMGEAGHFITILSETEDRYVVGDPLNGRSEHVKNEILDAFSFTGFFMHVTRGDGE